tara:strand:+ start:337 stop:996 length:660 start_codon:yes stop_codon:yes gene_type:complete
MLKLHGFNASNYVNIVKFALAEKQADYEFIDQFPGQDNNTLQISPMGKMPVLETEHGFLAETQVILEYIEEDAGGPALFPKDVYQRARVRQLMHMIEIYIELPARRCYPEMFFGGLVSEETKEQVREALPKGARALARVADFHPWLAGEQLTAADAFFLYSFDLASLLARKMFSIDLATEAPGSAELLKRLNERDSARKVAADRDAAMEKFLKYARGGK